MIGRELTNNIVELLRQFPAVVILGPRQVGKTTLALDIAENIHPSPIYLDLESPTDLAKLQDPEQYFELNKDRLIILDEIQRIPEIFPVLRGTIDRRRRAGQRTSQFLMLGSASLDLLKQTSESLAGRITYQELSGLLATEVPSTDLHKLWLRGGFPDSFLAINDEQSLNWRINFILTYLERDIPQFGPRIPATMLRRLWTMLAHNQGGQLNTAQLAASLEISSPTVKRYIELLEDLLLIRTLKPWHGNIGKRLTKTPKIYLRDSGITHALLNLPDINELLSHPVVGNSWEGFVIENLLSVIPLGNNYFYYRTSAHAEIDLVIEAGKRIMAIEIKRSTSPKVSRGFLNGCEDIKATERYIAYPGLERYPIGNDVTVMPVTELMNIIRGNK